MRKQILAAAIAALAVSGVAVAHEAGDVILRVGVAHVAPDVNSGKINVSGVGKLGGSKADVESNTQLGLTGTYIIAPHFGIEVLAATPFTHSIKVKGADAALRKVANLTEAQLPDGTVNGKFGKATHLPPTVSAQFFFLDPKSKFQPYVGLGLNYTWFYNESLSSKEKTAGFRGLDLDNSWGWAAQLGADIALTDSLFLNAAVWKIDINTKAKTKNTNPALGTNNTPVKVDVEVDPWVYFFGVGYKF
ncbi:MAG: outer membrane beta-barrel protein [Azoarcus sp.]|jgi:outer membrane protein|nr:outer membrane beta-barrel protein [Azoarcus sp.]